MLTIQPEVQRPNVSRRNGTYEYRGCIFAKTLQEIKKLYDYKILLPSKKNGSATMRQDALPYAYCAKKKRKNKRYRARSSQAKPGAPPTYPCGKKNKQTTKM